MWKLLVEVLRKDEAALVDITSGSSPSWLPGPLLYPVIAVGLVKGKPASVILTIGPSISSCSKVKLEKGLVKP